MSGAENQTIYTYLVKLIYFGGTDHMRTLSAVSQGSPHRERESMAQPGSIKVPISMDLSVSESASSVSG